MFGRVQIVNCHVSMYGCFSDIHLFLILLDYISHSIFEKPVKYFIVYFLSTII